MIEIQIPYMVFQNGALLQSGEDFDTVLHYARTLHRGSVDSRMQKQKHISSNQQHGGGVKRALETLLLLLCSLMAVIWGKSLNPAGPQGPHFSNGGGLRLKCSSVIFQSLAQLGRSY